MARSTSPLRYPGGKTCLYPIVSKILRTNRLERRHYAEPFAGGAGLALALLYEGHVSDIHINDVDPAIWAFWHSVLEATDELIDRIRTTPVSIDEWHTQRELFRKQDLADPVSLGFATFFLNRTNRSGIIKDAGVIGGLEQKGNYKIDCRFNRVDLERRVRRVARYRRRIHLTRIDALDFLAEQAERPASSIFLCIDPPYFKKGKGLYTSFYQAADHERLAKAILQLEHPWIVTYDNVPEIAAHYRDRRRFEFDINYSLEAKRKGTELLIASKGLILPREIRDRQVRNTSAVAA